ncbi:NAD(P)-binding protein [Hypoxylon sp. FL0890]|nr:NAD(P)-binding protein [Hypoxylon sp. FL0890]
MTATTLKGTIVLTGANGGLGSCVVAKIASSRDLADKYHGIYAVRDSSPTPTLRRALRPKQGSTSHPHEIISLNLERLENVREVATDINNRVSKEEIPAIHAVTVNYLSQWLMTLLLLQSMDRENGRVVVLGSHMHDPYNEFNSGAMGGYYADDKWKTMLTDSTKLSGLRRYGAAKLCLAVMVGELQQRLDDDLLLSNITVAGIDPGWMATGIVRRHPAVFRTSNRSAGDVVAIMFGNGAEAVQAEMSTEARDKGKRQMVWKDSVGYAKLKEGDTALMNWK